MGILPSAACESKHSPTKGSVAALYMHIYQLHSVIEILLLGSLYSEVNFYNPWAQSLRNLIFKVCCRLDLFHQPLDLGRELC